MNGWGRAWAMALAVLAVLAPAGVSYAAEPAQNDCGAEPFVELPVTMAGRRPLVRAKINGVDEFFLADSGAILSMISPDLAVRLMLPLRPAPKGLSMGGLGGALDIQVAKAGSFEIAGRTVNDVDFIVSGGNAGATGIIGQNILAMADTQYELATGMIRLVRASQCGERAASAWSAGQPYAAMEIEPMKGAQRHVAGTGSINGVSLRVVFDTGAPTTLLSLDAARRAGIHPGQSGVVPAGLANGLGGAVKESWLAPLASYRIGGRDIRGDALRIADLGDVPFDLLIGADFFLAHRVYVASSLGKLYFASVAVTDSAKSLPVLADAEAYGRRGSDLAIKGDIADAIADFTRAIELAPNEPRFLVLRSKARLDSKQDLLARHDLDQAIAMKSDFVEARLARAMLRVAEKSFALAGEDLAVAARVSLPDADHRIFIASVYAAIEDWQKSREQFDQWIQTHPGDARLPVALNASCWAGAMLNKGLARALDDCNAALSKAPERFEILDSRGMVLLRMGRFDDAIADYGAVLARQPNFAWSFYGRGLAKLRKGLAVEGKADLAAALQLEPEMSNKAQQIGLIASASDPR